MHFLKSCGFRLKGHLSPSASGFRQQRLSPADCAPLGPPGVLLGRLQALRLLLATEASDRRVEPALLHLAKRRAPAARDERRRVGLR